MKRFVVLALSLIFVCIATVACSPTPENHDDSEEIELELNDMQVRFGESAAIESELPQDLFDEVKYSFEGSNIKIESGRVYGLVPNTQTTVTATYENVSDRFLVTVTYDSLGVNVFTEEGGDIFAMEQNGGFVKQDVEYGEGFFYKDGEPFYGDSFSFSGTVEMTDCTEGAKTNIILSGGEENSVTYTLRYRGENDLVLECAKSGSAAEQLRELESGRMNFLLIWKQGKSYFYIDNKYIGLIESTIKDVHIGFGGENSKLSLYRLNGSTDSVFIDEMLSKIYASFGHHAYTVTDAVPGNFREIDDGVFLKRAYRYTQGFVYQDGIPIAGESYWASGTVEMLNPDLWGQVALIICKGDNDMVRFIFEHAGNGRYQIFADKKVNGSFIDYDLLSTASSKIRFSILHDKDTTSFFLNDEFLYEVKYDIGLSHFGIGGNNCQFIVSDLDCWIL